MLNAEKLLAWPFRDVHRTCTETDAMLYALSIGFGSDPEDAKQLTYVTEAQLRAFPTMALVLGMADDVGFLHDPDVGIDLPHMLHGETGLTFHRPLKPSGDVVSRLAIDHLVDRGEGRGALLYFSRTVRDAATDALIATETGSFFLRGNGGFGGQQGPSRRPAPVPDREPDAIEKVSTLPQAALLYRLTGDRNPLHAVPAVAQKAGFPRPILHGSCVYGTTARGLVQLLCAGNGDRMKRLDARFTAPVFPGESLLIEVWNKGPGQAAFRTRVPTRGVVAIDNGEFEYEVNA